MMPDGLTFVNSWWWPTSAGVADDITLLQRWIAGWSDLMAFEIVPVVLGKDTAALSGDL
jgi:uncharacterized protein DUF3303